MKKIFVIGDSISCYWGRHLKEMIQDRFDYDRKGGTHILKNIDDGTDGINGGDSPRVLTYLTERLKEKEFKPDYLLLNCGLHDVKRSLTGPDFQVPPPQYEENLKKICKMVKGKGIIIIWIRSTPANKNMKQAPPEIMTVRDNQDVVHYNSIADPIMEAEGIRTIDLYSFTYSLKGEIYINNGTDNVHFNERAAELQATFIAGWLFCLGN